MAGTHKFHSNVNLFWLWDCPSFPSSNHYTNTQNWSSKLKTFIYVKSVNCYFQNWLFLRVAFFSSVFATWPISTGLRALLQSRQPVSEPPFPKGRQRKGDAYCLLHGFSDLSPLLFWLWQLHSALLQLQRRTACTSDSACSQTASWTPALSPCCLAKWLQCRELVL